MYRNRYMVVTEDELITDHGDTLTYGIVHKDPAVWVVPYDGEKILLVGQYRYPVDSFSWEISAGHAEEYSLTEAAVRELREETGLSAQKLHEIGSFYVAPGHLNQVGHVYVATELMQGAQELEPGEKGMQMKWISVEEMNELIQKGEIQDGPTIASFKFFELYLDRRINKKKCDKSREQRKSLHWVRISTIFYVLAFPVVYYAVLFMTGMIVSTVRISGFFAYVLSVVLLLVPLLIPISLGGMRMAYARNEHKKTRLYCALPLLVFLIVVGLPSLLSYLCKGLF